MAAPRPEGAEETASEGLELDFSGIYGPTPQASGRLRSPSVSRRRLWMRPQQ